MKERPLNLAVSFLVYELPESWYCTLKRKLNHLFGEKLMEPVANFSHPAGQSHLYAVAAVDSNGDAVAFQGNVSYSSDTPSVATATANPAVSQDAQVTVAYLTPGTANITCSALDANGTPFSATFQVTVTTGLAVSFKVTELN